MDWLINFIINSSNNFSHIQDFNIIISLIKSKQNNTDYISQNSDNRCRHIFYRPQFSNERYGTDYIISQDNNNIQNG
jgi:hypothetical protein